MLLASLQSCRISIILLHFKYFKAINYWKFCSACLLWNSCCIMSHQMMWKFMSNSYYRLSQPFWFAIQSYWLIWLINVDDRNELATVVSRRTRNCFPWASIATVSWIVSGVFSSSITNACLSEYCIVASRWD